MEENERIELYEFLEKMSRSLEERLTVSLAPVQRELRELRGEMRDGIAQMNARMESIETVWRIVRDYGRGLDERSIRIACWPSSVFGRRN